MISVGDNNPMKRPEIRSIISQSKREWWANPENKKLLSGENSPLYKCGKIKKTCLYCGNIFDVHPCNANRKNNKYCSKPCAYKARNKKIEKVCVVCGSKFFVSPSQKNKKYCKLECYRKNNRGKNHYSYGKSNKIKRACKICGKEFFKKPSNIKQGYGIYCSVKCRSEDVEWRQKISTPSLQKSLAKKEWWKNPENKRFFSENNPMKNPDIAKKQSLAACGKPRPWVQGERNPNFNGYSTRWPYCHLFSPDLKERIRSFFNYKCFACGKDEKDNGRALIAHHVTYDKLACCHLENIKKLYDMTNDQVMAIEMADDQTARLIKAYNLSPDHIKEIEEDRTNDNLLMDKYNVPEEYRWMFVSLCSSCHGKTIPIKSRNYWKLHYIEKLMRETGGKSFYSDEEMRQIKSIN